MANAVVIGAQWGDEGKAKITDLLAEYADIIIRYQGGCNAGHTVVANGETYKFHLVPSGILYPGKVCIIGSGTVINPEVLMKEINGLKEKGIDVSGLHISMSAHITLPYHIDIDGSSEKSLGKKKIGTTNRGIGPTYADKINRVGIRIEDLYDDEALNDKLDLILPQKNKVLEDIYGLKGYTKQE
ncbi:MAG TPA: adenylosuccinate synthase, partial [Cyanobacteria bacterium UBA9579]|nr:adenylosuccinate synthase [Cyanobacteria bacterium UBA9579]